MLTKCSAVYGPYDIPLFELLVRLYPFLLTLTKLVKKQEEYQTLGVGYLRRLCLPVHPMRSCMGTGRLHHVLGVVSASS